MESLLRTFTVELGLDSRIYHNPATFGEPLQALLFQLIFRQRVILDNKVEQVGRTAGVVGVKEIISKALLNTGKRGIQPIAPQLTKQLGCFVFCDKCLFQFANGLRASSNNSGCMPGGLMPISDKCCWS